jgi:hypothetical protein
MKAIIALSSLALLGAPGLRAGESKKSLDKDSARFLAAIDLIETSDQNVQILKGMETLRGGFPKSRAVLHATAGTGSAKVKAFAIQVLGEKGETGKDLDVCVEGLKDSSDMVRLAAVMAIQRMCKKKEGYKALLDYLPGEKVANNRKMAVKTLQRWEAKESVPFLVDMLTREKEKNVRNFIVTALQVLTGAKHGDDVESWKAFAEEAELQSEARTLLYTSKKEEKK